MSDEIDCKITAPGKSYQPFIAPSSQNESDRRVKVDVSVDIVNILNILEIKSIIQVRFFLYLSWHDPRLVFFNLKSDSGLNVLSKEEREGLWLPKLVFSNTADMQSTLVDDNAVLSVQRDGQYQVQDITEAENKYLYDGKDNKLVLSRFYNIDFLCNYRMNWFPFDIQECQMVIGIKGKGKELINLAIEKLKYLGEDSVNQYVIRTSELVKMEETNQIKVVIKMDRNLLTIVLTTIVPTVLLNMITYSTTFFKDSHFEAAVAVNLTVMLVLATLFISVSYNNHCTRIFMHFNHTGEFQPACYLIH